MVWYVAVLDFADSIEVAADHVSVCLAGTSGGSVILEASVAVVALAIVITANVSTG